MFTSVSIFFFVLSLRTVKSDEPVYSAVGDEVVLKPGPVQGPITNIMWKHGQDIAIESYQGSVEGYRQFKERGSLNVTTGALTITGLTPGESGSYTAEINNKVTSTTQLLVISRVSKPTVSTQCDADHCVFTCESNDTTAEPVTYSWMAEDKSWTSTKEINITNDESEKLFHCELRNPVSTEMSESVHNPFTTWKWYNTVLIICSTLLIGGLTFFIFFIGFILYKRKKTKGDWYNTVLIICPVLLNGGLIFFILFIFIVLLRRNRFKDDWYYTALIYGSILVNDFLIFVIFFIVYKRNRIIGKCFRKQLICESLLFICLLVLFILYKLERIKDGWYYDVLIYGSMGLNVCLIVFIFYKKYERVRRVITQSLFGSLSHIFYQRDADNPAPGSEPPEGSNHGPATNGPSETRPENVSEVEGSMNHVPTPTAPLENSEERESLMGSSRDPESDVPSETSRKDVSETILEVPSFQVHTNQTASEDTANETEVPGGSNQDPTSDAAPESSSETDIGASPDQVLTDATNEAGV